MLNQFCVNRLSDRAYEWNIQDLWHPSYYVDLVKKVGHFRVPLCLCFKASLSVKPFLRKWLWFAWKWNCMQNSFSSHLDSFWNRGTIINGLLQYVYWNRGYPDNENQSDGRTETIDSNIFKSSQSNVRCKTMKSQLVVCDAYATMLSLINKLSSSNR